MLHKDFRIELHRSSKFNCCALHSQSIRLRYDCMAPFIFKPDSKAHLHSSFQTIIFLCQHVFGRLQLKSDLLISFCILSNKTTLQEKIRISHYRAFNRLLEAALNACKLLLKFIWKIFLVTSINLNLKNFRSFQAFSALSCFGLAGFLLHSLSIMIVIVLIVKDFIQLHLLKFLLLPPSLIHFSIC